MRLHQFSRQVIGIVTIEIAGKCARLIDLALAKRGFSHEEQAGARVGFLSQNFFQIFDRNTDVIGIAALHFNARAQGERLSIVRIIFQNAFNFVPGSGEIAAHQGDLGEPVMTLCIVG